MRVGIIGKQCSGKTLVAKIMREMYGGEIVKFASPIYETLSLLGKQKNRLFMQEFSDIAKKHFGESIFIDLLEQRLKTIMCNNLYCDDIRYKAEADMLRKYGFKFIFVKADDDVRKRRVLEQGLEFYENHSSELINFIIPDAYIITNNDTIARLREQIKNFYTIYSR